MSKAWSEVFTALRFLADRVDLLVEASEATERAEEMFCRGSRLIVDASDTEK
jgi:hypothetical protein